LRDRLSAVATVLRMKKRESINGNGGNCLANATLSAHTLGIEFRPNDLASPRAARLT
jgi:hypothetical protein